MSSAFIGAMGALIAVIASGLFAYLVHRENLRDQRLKDRLERIYEAHDALIRSYESTLHAVHMIFEQPATYHEQAMTALPQISTFFARYSHLQIPEEDDLGDAVYAATQGLLEAAQSNDGTARDSLAPQLHANAEAVGKQLIRLAGETESERARGWFSWRRQ